MLFTPLLQGGVSSGDTRTLVCVNTLAKRNKQPQGLQKIDWSNPITNGLVLCTHAGNNFVEMTTNKPSVITGATSTATPKGKALANASSTFSIETPINKHYGEAVTWVIGAQINSNGGGGFGKLVDKSNAAAPASGTEQLLIENGISLSRSGSGGTQRVTTPLSLPAPYNIYAVSVSSFTATDGAWYINGVPKPLGVASIAGIGTLNTTTANYVLCNRTNDYLRNVDGKMDFAYRWNRVLSPAEIASISANPYQIFKAVTKPIYVAAKSLTRRSIKLPSRKRITQPQTTPQISNYWKSRGFKWVVNGTQPRELVSGVTLDPTAGATTEVNHSGKALANRSTGVGWTKSVSSAPAKTATLVWFGDFYAFADANPFVAGILPNLTDTSPYANVSIIRNRSGSGTGSIGYFYGSASGSVVIASSPNTDYNEAKNLGIVVKLKEGSQKLFTNKRGLEVQNTASLSGGSFYTATPFLVIGSGHVGRNADASCSLFAVSDQFLTDEECLSLAKNPWQIFKAIDQPLYLASTPRPRSFVKVKTKPQTKQPQVSTSINWANPITKGLVKAINAAASDPTVTLLGTSPTPLKVTSPVGIGYSANGGTSYWQASPIALASLNPTWTILTIVSNFNNAGNNQGGFGLYVERPNNTQIAKICVGQNQSFSQAEFTCRDLSNNLIQMRPSYGSGGGPNVSDGKPHVMVFTRRASNNHRGWIDGVERVFNTAVNINGAFAATNATIGVDPFDVVTFNGSVPLVLVWNRSLSNKELLSISQNPWQVFKAPNDAIFLEQPTTVSAIAPSTLFAELFSGINTLYTHTVNSLYALLADLYTNSSTLYSGSISSIRVLLASLYTNSSTLYSNTISSTRVLLASLYNNAGELYNHSVSIWQNSVINYLSNLRTKVVTATTKAIDAISTTRTKVLAASTKALNALSATRTKLFTTGIKSVSVTSASRTKVFTPETKSKTFTTTTRG